MALSRGCSGDYEIWGTTGGYGSDLFFIGGLAKEECEDRMVRISSNFALGEECELYALEEPGKYTGRNTAAAARASLDHQGIDYTEGAFHVAAAAGDLAAVRRFVEAGMSVETASEFDVTVLMRAAGSGSLETVKFLVGQGADVRATSYRGFTVLIFAAHGGHSEGHLDVVKFLVGKGASIKARDNHGWSAWNYAASEGHTAIAAYLKSQGG